VLSTGADVNLLVLDTEVYSNTSSQASKSTPMGAVAKFAASGKQNRKKDLGMMAMTYGNVYVAQVAMGSNPNQTLRAMIEAEQHKGPSLIIAYSPCVSHGILTGMGTSIMEEKKAVEAGYWHLYRYNPVLKAEGKNPFQLDSKEPKGSFHNFLKGELRYSQLFSMFPDRAESLLDEAQKISREKYELYRRLSEIK
jgi:pyruvate-ferredoxin/flavodoxin oxidoreductase